jgi:starch phosphorylase
MLQLRPRTADNLGMSVNDPALERRLGRLGLTGHEDGWTDRYLLCTHLVDPRAAESRQKFEAASRFLRDLVAHRWVKTRRLRAEAAPKRIHYLSMEFLLCRRPAGTCRA